jgi:hypothetical protein
MDEPALLVGRARDPAECAVTFPRIALSALFLGSVLAGTAQQAAARDARAVVELFTSQGCSSCPPADRVLSELSHDPSIVAISLPIDYWDYLGWKDTLASPRNTARQQAYAHARNDRNIYTPQAVVNGVAQVLGSDKTAIERATAPALMLPVSVDTTDGKFRVAVPDGRTERSAQVWICAIKRQAAVTVKRGENEGHTLTYTNVARGWIRLGDWSGKAANWSVPVSDIRASGADAAAVLVQSGDDASPGPMLGAAFAALP